MRQIPITIIVALPSVRARVPSRTIIHPKHASSLRASCQTLDNRPHNHGLYSSDRTILWKDAPKIQHASDATGGKIRPAIIERRIQCSEGNTVHCRGHWRES